MINKPAGPTTPVYKILPASDWQEALICGSYQGSPDDRRDGFIHFSTADQLAGTASKHFRGKEDLLLVAVDRAPLGSALRFEPSRGGDLFPHLYSPLPVSAALWTRPLPLGADGIPLLPKELEP